MQFAPILLTLIALAGCQATTPEQQAEVAKWRDTADFYADVLARARAAVEIEPPGPKRDALVLDLQRTQWLYDFARALAFGPTTRPAQ